MEYAATAKKCKTTQPFLGDPPENPAAFFMFQTLADNFLTASRRFFFRRTKLPVRPPPDGGTPPVPAAPPGVRVPGLRQRVIRQYDGVKGISRGKARLLTKESGPGRGSQIPPLRHGEEGGVPVIHHPPGLGSPDGGRRHVKQIQMIASGDVAAKSHLYAFVQHPPYRRHAGAEILIGVGTVDHRYPGVLHGLPLPLVRPDAVGHHGAVIPKAVLLVGLPILSAIRVELAYPVHLRAVFRQVGLHRADRAPPPAFPKMPSAHSCRRG